MRDSDTTREETAVALRSISILSSATQLALIAWTHCALSELNSPRLLADYLPWQIGGRSGVDFKVGHCARPGLRHRRDKEYAYRR
jgi:hypothetical protein